MATGNLSAELRKTLNSMRKRGTEISEKKVDCLMAGCEEKSKTFRVIAKHFPKYTFTQGSVRIPLRFSVLRVVLHEKLEVFH